jgi:chromate transporter
MHRILVEEKRWISEARFLHALNYCMLLPGPEAQQLATYVGWLLHRSAGGMAAGLLFVLPGALLMLVLASLYAAYHEVALVAALFFGLKPAVLAVVVEAVQRLGRRALHGRVHVGIAALAFVAIFFFSVPFPAIVAGAALLGAAGGALLPGAFSAHAVPAPGDGGAADSVLDEGASHTQPSVRRAARVALLWGSLWLGPVALLVVALGRGDVFVEIAIFFSKAAIVTFGGAYAVLAYIAQQAVEVHGWMQPGEMLGGLGLAETTPGPLILVTQFVGFLAAFRDPGTLPPLLAGAFGAALTTWCTFAPCFLWIFLGAPYVEALRGRRGLAAALGAITAAVVGVILNLALWFALHVLFGEVTEHHRGSVRWLVPDVDTLDPAAAAIAAAALVAMLRFRVGMLPTLAAAAAAGALYRLGPGP